MAHSSLKPGTQVLTQAGESSDELETAKLD